MCVLGEGGVDECVCIRGGEGGGCRLRVLPAALSNCYSGYSCRLLCVNNFFWHLTRWNKSVIIIGCFLWLLMKLMTAYIWKSYIRNADKDMNMKSIFAVMNATWAVVKTRPGEILVYLEPT